MKASVPTEYGKFGLGSVNIGGEQDLGDERPKLV